MNRPEATKATTRLLDQAFGDWVAGHLVEDPALRPVARRLATAASLALDLKHTCLDLDKVPALAQPALDRLLEGLGPDDVQSLPVTACDIRPGHAPLVRSEDGKRLWLHKYRWFETRLAARVRALADPVLAIPGSVSDALDRLYPDAESDQRSAVETALTRQLAVITGGPGTGKTWTVARLIALVLVGHPEHRIALAAPTGKAANRMMESLRKAVRDDTALLSVLDGLAMPGKATTLHALLGIGRHSPHPRHDAANPLPADVVIVDEASMVDLPMMTRLFEALPEAARLVLLGDRDQLASVEAGGVLAELCRPQAPLLYGDRPGPVAVLQTNYRSTSAINALASVVNQGGALSPDLLDNDTVRHRVTSPVEPAAWLTPATAHYESMAGGLLDGAPVTDLLKALPAFQLLCALRDGPFGVTGLNARLEHRFGTREAAQSGRPYRREGQAWYAGLPVMVTANDHERRLYNGDVGWVLPVREVDPDSANAGQSAWVVDTAAGELRACFPGGTPRAVRFAQMPAFETAYALTVHKSQGSEYDHVVLVLPDDAARAAENPVLTRELLYTGITRAAQRLDIHAGEGVLAAMVARRTVRMSGLAAG